MPPILMYHHIGDPPANSTEKPALFVSAQSFEAQLAWLKANRYATISLDDLCAHWTNGQPLPRRSVVLTFDDGYTNNYEFAFPLLKKYGFQAVFFITTGCIGGFDKNGHAHIPAAQMREMHQAGMTIGSHTVSHAWLAKLPPEQAEAELRESKATLEAILGEPVKYLCYPSGSFSGGVIESARQLGYAGACSVIRDNRPQPHQLFWLPRIMIMRDTPATRFPYLFGYLYHFLHLQKNRKRWAGRV